LKSIVVNEIDIGKKCQELRGVNNFCDTILPYHNIA
jgi:hypothetical protein